MGVGRLTVGLKNRRRLIFDDQQLYIRGIKLARLSFTAV